MTNTVYMQQTSGLQHQMVCDGPASQSDADLLSLFVSRSRTQTPLEKAQDILKSVPLPNMYNESGYSNLLSLGLTQRQLAMISAGMELARRSIQQEISNTDVMNSPGLVTEYLKLKLGSCEHEVFSAIFLDNRHRVIAYKELFQGTIDSAAVYPREVVKACLNLNSAAVIFSHNHPSGLAEPSDTDVRITRKLTDALSLVDIRVLDHIVIGKGTSTSMAERGLM